MKFFSVCTRFDHIRIEGIKRPIWEFIPQYLQPDGWLISLNYLDKPQKHPPTPVIWDCGAWSYRNRPYPDYDPQMALKIYDQVAQQGDIVVAPDHMIIEDSHGLFRSIMTSWMSLEVWIISSTVRLRS